MSMGNPGSTTGAGGDVNNLLVQGFKAAKENRRDEAYSLFCEVVKRDASNELGWLYRAATTDDLSEAYVCLQKVLSINPGNDKAQRGIERIQARLNSEEENATIPGISDIPTSGSSPMMGATPQSRVGNEEVISGFNPGIRPAMPNNPEDLRPAAPYSLENQPDPYNFPQPGFPPQGEPMPNYPGNPPPAFGSDYGNDMDMPGFNSPPPAYPRTQQMPDMGGGYNEPQFNAPQPYSGYNQPEDDMLEEPFQDAVTSGPGQSRRQTTSTGRRKPGAGLSPVFAGMAGARQRGRAAFGSEGNTNLDATGQDRSRNLQRNLMLIGVILLLAALAILFIILTRQPTPTTDGGEQAAAAATATAAAGSGSITAGGVGISTPIVNVTPGTSPNVTSGPAISVPVVGGTTVTNNPATAAPSQTTAAPPPQVTTAAAPPPPAGGPPRPIVYTIKSGDTLDGIARQYSTSYTILQSVNGIANARQIFNGQKIVVPVGRPDFTGKGVILKDGETLQTIADRYKLGLDGLLKLNSLANPNDVKAGDAVLIP